MHRSSSHASDHFVNELHEALAHQYPVLRVLDDAIHAGSLVAEGATLPIVPDDRGLARLYLHLYAVPLLEATGLLSDESSLATLWAAAQVGFGLHIRYMDYLLDDQDVAATVAATRAQSYLSQTQSLLASGGWNWGVDQIAYYLQFLDYEESVRRGSRVDFELLWLRVSPLAIAPETYLTARTTTDARRAYRRFLSWSLLQADLEDVVEDLARGIRTPITIRAAELVTGSSTDLGRLAALVDQIQEFANAVRNDLRTNFDGLPASQTVVDHMYATFLSHHPL